MKNIIAIVLVISALSIFISKKLDIYSSWKKVKATVTEINKLMSKSNVGEVKYEYKIGKKTYNGSVYLHNQKDLDKILQNKDKTMNVYYHWLNHELSIVNIPTNLEDILLVIISVIGSLYLYFYSCENCQVVTTVPNSVKVL